MGDQHHHDDYEGLCIQYIDFVTKIRKEKEREWEEESWAAGYGN